MAPRVLLLLMCLPLRADGLGDLRATLGRLKGAEATKVALEYQFWRELKTGKLPEVTQGTVTAQVEDGPQGLRVTWEHATQEKAEAELQAGFLDPARVQPTAQILRSLTPLDIGVHLHGAQTLARELTGAQLLETRPEAWAGKPATVLVLKLEADLNPNLRKAIKEIKARGWVWLGPDGVPLAFRTEVDYTGSRFLIRFKGTQREEVHFAARGNRLQVTWAQNEERTSGFGESMATKRVYRLTAN